MSERKPLVLVLAGPNGSGKSTITQFFDIVGNYTNADDMVASTGMSNEDAAVLADKMRYRSIELKEDFTFEPCYPRITRWIFLKKQNRKDIS